MKVHPVIASAIVGAIIALQAWTLSRVVALQVDVAVIKTQISGPPKVASR
jgi:hypothetical protein